MTKDSIGNDAMNKDPTAQASLLLLDRVGLRDAPLVGKKAATLGELRQAGFPVPAGVCLTTALFRRVTKAWQSEIQDVYEEYRLAAAHDSEETLRSELLPLAQRLQSLLTDVELPEDVENQLFDLLQTISDADGVFCVRSSATAEDRADRSFAGQYETVLGVRGKSGLRAAVIACWKSFFSPHALAARAKANALNGDEGMAALIQPLIEADCSGVAFSVDPTDPTSEHIVIDAAWGLGPGVVDGRAPSDTTWVDRRTLKIARQKVVEKTHRIGLNADGDLVAEEVSGDRQRSACLPDAWARRVAEGVMATERLLGSPQDLEWAIAGQRAWILQSRPITGLSHRSRHPDFPVAWSSDEERRAYWRLDGAPQGRLLLPLEHDVRYASERAVEDAAYVNGSNHRGPRFQAQRSIEINGRRYVRWVDLPLTEGDLLARSRAADDLGRRWQQQRITPWEYVAPEVIAATERLGRVDWDSAADADLAEAFEDAFGVYRRHWMIHWSYGRGRGVLTAPFYEAFETITGLKGSEAEEKALPLLEGDDNLFTRMMDSLYELAVTARKDRDVTAAVASSSPDAIRKLEESEAGKAFLRQLDAFMAQYGDRSGSGFGSRPSITYPTWREDPQTVFALIRPFLDDRLESPKQARERSNRARVQDIEKLLASSSDAEAVAAFREWLPLMRRLRADLENHNHYIDQLSLGQLRAAAMGAARRLVAKKSIAEAQDVFWLRRNEISAALKADPPHDLHDLVRQRKAEHEAWRSLEPPLFLGVPPAELDPRPEFQDDVTRLAAQGDERLAASATDRFQLSGQAASPGRRVGRARIVPMDALLPDLKPGDILVAENAGPMWTPLFPILGGLVLEQGALFQHAATTAREYGVPAVIKAPDATRRIPDGALIEIDGAAGIVTLQEGQIPQAAPEEGLGTA